VEGVIAFRGERGLPFYWGGLEAKVNWLFSPIPEWRAVDSTIDAIGILALGCTMLFPASLIPKKDIVVSSWQSMPTPFWRDLEGDAAIFEDLPDCIGRAIGPPLIGRSWVSEPSPIFPAADPGNRFLAMAIESNESSSKALS
jgi:hypothetical protein